MSFHKVLRTPLQSMAAGALLALCTVGSAQAQVYGFNQFLSGGGGGQDPARRQLAQSMGAYICMGVAPGTKPGTVNFTVWSRIPQPRARINAVAFDLGRHAGLLTAVSVGMASPGVTGAPGPAQVHPFLRGLTPEFWINVPQKGHMKPDGLSPGKMITLEGTLGPGKTITDVLEALNEGLSPASAVSGLRVGVMTLYLLGGPPPGVATIQDDGGFSTTIPSGACG